MAKSKKSRRARRQIKQKRAAVEQVAERQSPATTGEAVRVGAVTDGSAPSGKTVDIASSNNRKAVNFAQEYLYVYKEMRNILMISVVMLIVLVGLSFVI